MVQTERRIDWERRAMFDVSKAEIYRRLREGKITAEEARAEIMRLQEMYRNNRTAQVA